MERNKEERSGSRWGARGVIAAAVFGAVLAVTPVQAQIPAIEYGACGPMDVVFLIDTTGSMGAAINNITGDLGTIVSTIQNASGDDERLGLVVANGYASPTFDSQQYDCLITDSRLDSLEFIGQTVGDCLIVLRDLNSTTTDVQNSIGALTVTGGGFLPEITAEGLKTILLGVGQTPDMVAADLDPPIPAPQVAPPVAAPGTLTNGWPRLQWNDWNVGFRDAPAKRVVFLLTDAAPGGPNSQNEAADDALAAQMAANYGTAGVIIQPVLVGVQICQGGDHNNVLVTDLLLGESCSDGGGSAVDHYLPKAESIMQAYADQTGGVLTKVPFSGEGTALAIVSIIENCGGDLEEKEGRMTGGGSIFHENDKKNPRVTHGFTLHCDGGPNKLQINWPGNRFHMEMLTEASCYDYPELDEQNPVAGFDTIVGTGVGRLNGVSGATVAFRFVDDGEPGKVSDTASITISKGGTVLEVVGTLQNGNHQAHKEN